MMGSQISGISTLSDASATIRSEERASVLFPNGFWGFFSVLTQQCVLAHA